MNVRAALMVGSVLVAGGLAGDSALAQAAPAPAPIGPLFATPTCIAKSPKDCRLADGHPDLTGLYVPGGSDLAGLGSGADSVTFGGRGGSFAGFDADGGLYRQTRDYGDPGPGSPSTTKAPRYKPEFWDAIVDAEYNGNFDDPGGRCMPSGVPRLGPPAQIIVLKDSPFVLLIYSLREIRIVPIDGRAHNMVTVTAETWNGDPVGHWERDTLVIETVGFTDASWLGKSGFLHGFDMKVTERLTRTGNALKWEATVEDPEYLAEPYVVTPVTRNITTDPTAALVEPLPCDERDRAHAKSHMRNG